MNKILPILGVRKFARIFTFQIFNINLASYVFFVFKFDFVSNFLFNPRMESDSRSKSIVRDVAVCFCIVTYFK